ncbi:expressed unknown protein [Seminavis robusta]|uniref:Uncharacterized protein n=1 Tax=Seminavis robusta TaxID=568900 RepID=A0A9N8DJR1_9STRA|nr:expressed unknown protein [Seminavis robusta]|eukprot:Sro160_g072021.1  (735) ;mRNA; f:14243-16447
MSSLIAFADAQDELLAKSANKQQNALNHFDHFLKTYCVQISVPLATAASIPYEGLKGEEPRSPKSINEFWGKMIGAFFTYMGTEARIYCSPKGRRLAYQSATQYCSSVKLYFISRFRYDPPISVFSIDQWKRLREKLRSLYREGCRASGKRMTEGKASSTRDDREAMATGCIWLGTAEAAEFWHLLNTSYHCSGRGSEVALVRTESLSCVEVNESVYQYRVLQLDIQRDKCGPFQSLPIYPHRDGVFEDFYFSLIYQVVLVGCDSPYIFPMFSREALKTTSGKSDSKVSSLWSNLFDDLRNTFEELSDRINEKLSSHCQRKGSNQVMAESPSVSGIAQIFRTGWELRGCDTLFEYICGSFVMSQHAGKTISRWTAKIGDLIVGGQPPMFDDIEVTSGLKRFTDALFEDDTSGRWNPKVRELLVMALLLRYDQFLDILESHPEARRPASEDACMRQRFYHDHLFVCRVKQALDKARVGEVQFSGWVSESHDAFMSRNIPGIPIEKFSLYSGNKDSILMDPRCFVDHFNVLATVTQTMHTNIQRLQHTVNDIRRNQQSSRVLEDFMLENFQKLTKSVERIEARVVGESKPSTATQQEGIIKFSVSSKALTKQMSVADVAVAFFVDNHPEGFRLDKESESWNNLTPSEKKRIRNLFGTVKRAVKVLLLQLDSYPSTKSKDVLRKMFLDAEDRIRSRLGFGNKLITVYTLTQHEEVRQLESARLPDDSPESVRKFFKS